MKITVVELNNKELIIRSTSPNTVLLGQVYYITYKDEKKYFEVVSIFMTNKDMYTVELKEIGYYSKKIAYYKAYFDLKDIMFEELTLVENIEEIKKVR